MGTEMRVEQLLPVIAYGDACGLPFEAKGPQPEGSITELPPITHNKYLEIPEALKGQAGIWSDDTHLSLASALSLCRAGGFDLADQGYVQTTAYEHATGSELDSNLIPPVIATRRNGFGRSTRRSFERLNEGVQPDKSGESGGAGNGVLMKIAPLVYWQMASMLDGDTAERQLTEFTRMTHDSPEAVVSSLVHAVVLKQLLMHDTEEAKGRLARTPEQEFRRIYTDAIYGARLFEDDFPDERPSVSETLGRIAHDLDSPEGHFSRDHILSRIEGKNGGGFYAPETLMMAYGSFAIENRFPQSVYRAAELGGDADSIASIVATMSLFFHGKVEEPEDMEKVFAIDRLRRVSAKLEDLEG